MSHLDTKPDPRELVARLASDHRTRWQAFEQLVALGAAARDPVREGLGHANWEVRRWCAIWLDHHADPETLGALVPLLRDPKSKVRLFAVHSIACERCKSGENPIDVVPLLIERIRLDESLRVRRHAVAMLASQHAHPDLEGFFQELLDTETDAKLHKHAGIGLVMCRRPDLTVADAARLAAKQVGRSTPGRGAGARAGSSARSCATREGES